MRMPLFLLGLCAPACAQLGTPHSAYEGDTSGCGRSHGNSPGRSLPREIESGGSERNYTIHLPSNYSSDHQHPMVLGFHGSMSIGAYFEADTRFSDAANGFIMVYPNGLRGSWAGANYSSASIEEDLQFVWDMLVDLRQEYCVDSARIYATGMSIGGGFIDTIACNATVGREFAAFAPVSGAFYADNNENYKECKPAAPLPMFSIHGAKDTSVPYDGGEGSGGKLPAIEDWLDRWANRNDCDDGAADERVRDGMVSERWRCSEQGAMQHLKLVNQNHSWPSTEPNFSQDVANDDPAPVEANELILDFFMRFYRTARSDDPSPAPTPTSAATTTSSTSQTSQTDEPETTSDSSETETDSADEPEPSAAWRVGVDLGFVLLIMALQVLMTL